MHNTLKRIIIIFFFGVLLIFGIFSADFVIEPVKHFFNNDISFRELTGNIERNFSDNCIGRKNLIHINGLYSRMIGKIELNNVIILQNGMLGSMDSQRVDQSDNARKIIDFSAFLKNNGVEYLYIQAPDKVDICNELLPDGADHFANDNADDIVGILTEKNVNVIDLRHVISYDPESINKYFYKTDHHWNALGAFEGYKEILNGIENIYGDSVGINEDNSEIERWTVNRKEKCFLGSQGKRVGRFFGGIDDLMWLTPDFETDMSCSIPYNDLFYKGDFSKANIRSEYFTEEKDLFDDNPYCVYIGLDYPLVQHRNANAPSDLKILLLKDSYSLPVQSYLSTQFKEVDVIDLRAFRECSVLDFVINNRPDIVLMMNTPLSLENDQFFDFGELTAEQIFDGNIKVCEEMAFGSADSYALVFDGLYYSRTYKLKIGDISEEDSSSIHIIVRDKKEGKEIVSRIIDSEYYADGYELTFVTPLVGDGEIELLIYPDLVGEANDSSMVLKNISLECS